jgi:phosphate transport system substrate-binding protein
MKHGLIISIAPSGEHTSAIARPAIIILAIVLLLLPGCRSDTQSGSEGGEPRRAIQNKGSDTIVNIALAWAEEYRIVDPSVSIAVTGGGSGTGIASLINGTVDIANASRSMKENEIDDARANDIEAIGHFHRPYNQLEGSRWR